MSQGVIDQVRPADLNQWFERAAADASGTPLLLDVREPAEWQAASVPADGFAVLMIAMGNVPQRLAELDPDRPIACLCHHGARSAQVAHFLMQNGFSAVVNITGGIHAWSQQRDPGVPVY